MRRALPPDTLHVVKMGPVSLQHWGVCTWPNASKGLLWPKWRSVKSLLNNIVFSPCVIRFTVTSVENKLWFFRFQKWVQMTHVEAEKNVQGRSLLPELKSCLPGRCRLGNTEGFWSYNPPHGHILNKSNHFSNMYKSVFVILQLHSFFCWFIQLLTAKKIWITIILGSLGS